MPTLHVTPETVESLQSIADCLWKARKVVIITGAGISTNSGIPDFRSENGLYSLIQAQFEAASRSQAAATPSIDVAQASNSPAVQSEPKDQTDGGSEERAPKRLKLSPPSPTTSAAAGQEVPCRDGETRGTWPSQGDDAHSPPTQASDSTGAGNQLTLTSDQRKAPNEDQKQAGGGDDHLNQEPLGTVSPSPPPALPQNFNAPGLQTSPASSPGLAPNPGEPPGSGFPALSPTRRTLPAPLVSLSSPLSSPPPVLFDPYEGQSSPSTTHNSSSASSESGETPPSSAPLSQVSASSHRASLPNMKGKDLFDASIWSDPVRTSVFYTFTTNLRRKAKEVAPTTTHHFISHLRDKGKLVRCYTQNIDEIEEKVGLSTSLGLGPGSRSRFSKRSSRASAPAALGRSDSDPGVLIEPPSGGVECVFLHGSLSALRCFVCSQTSNWEEGDRESETLSGRQPSCPRCIESTAAREGRGKRALGVGKLRPDIVLYGEEHPSDHLISPIVQHDLSLNPDMLLILGTSLRVHGLRRMVKEFAKAVHTNGGGKVVFVNLTKPPDSVWADILDFWVEMDCDTWVNDLRSSRKPILWLPPGTILEKKQQKQQKGAKGAKGPPKRSESKCGPKASTAKDPVTDDPGNATKAPKSSKTPKTRPRGSAGPVVRDPQLRDDNENNAHLLWIIHKNLARIGGRKNTYASWVQNPLGPTPVSKKMKMIRISSSSMAADPKARSIDQDSLQTERRLATQPQHSTLETQPTTKPKRALIRRKPARKPAQKLAQKLGPSTGLTPRPRTATELPHTLFGGDGQPAAACLAPTWTTEPGVSPLGIAMTPASHVHVEEPSHPAGPAGVGDAASTPADPSASAMGIAAAIKSNPRKRKRKMIDGVEVLPFPGSRSARPTPDGISQLKRSSACRSGSGNEEATLRPSMPTVDHVINYGDMESGGAGRRTALCSPRNPRGFGYTNYQLAPLVNLHGDGHPGTGGPYQRVMASRDRVNGFPPGAHEHGVPLPGLQEQGISHHGSQYEAHHGTHYGTYYGTHYERHYERHYETYYDTNAENHHRTHQGWAHDGSPDEGIEHRDMQTHSIRAPEGSLPQQDLPPQSMWVHSASQPSMPSLDPCEELPSTRTRQVPPLLEPTPTATGPSFSVPVGITPFSSMPGPSTHWEQHFDMSDPFQLYQPLVRNMDPPHLRPHRRHDWVSGGERIQWDEGIASESRLMGPADSPFVDPNVQPDDGEDAQAAEAEAARTLFNLRGSVLVP